MPRKKNEAVRLSNPYDPLWGFENENERSRFIAGTLLDAGIHDLFYKRYWYQRALQPTVRRLKNNREGLVVEIVGLPRAGKSTNMRLVSGTLPFEVIEELEFLQPNGNVTYPFEDEDIKSFQLSDANMLASIIKLQIAFRILSRRVDWQFDYAKSRGAITKPNHTLVYRGPNDSLCMNRFMEVLQTTDHEDPYLISLVRDLITQTYTSTWVDVVILFGVSYDTAVQRRIDAGLPHNGSVVNPVVWPRIAKGYTWWEEYIFPFLRKNYGTGLLVVNGEESIEHNKLLVEDYLNEALAKFHKYNG